MHKPVEPIICGICLDKLPRSKTVLNCGHKYCDDCICEWILEKPATEANCPTCRAKVSQQQYKNAVVWGVRNSHLHTCEMIHYNISELPVENFLFLYINCKMEKIYTEEELAIFKKELIENNQNELLEKLETCKTQAVSVYARTKNFPELPKVLYRFL
jgi:hypothetical protein